MNMKEYFDKVYDRRGTNCFKWDLNKKGFQREDIISMWVADMDLPTAPEVKEALKNRALHPLFGYTFRDDDYFEAYINWQKKRNAWDIEREWILNSTSVVISINLIIRALTDKNDKILILTPVYGQFSASVNDTGRKLVNSKMINDDGYYKMDFDDIEEKMKNGVKILVFCSPHNPVGRVWKEDELLHISELCLKYNVLMLSDEIHSDLIYSESKHIPVASISEEISQNTITCCAPGKTFNISGLSIGFIIIKNKEIRDKVHDFYSTHHLLAANVFGIVAAQAAYEKGEKWLNNVITYLQNNRDYLIEYIKNEIPLIKVVPCEGTYLAWLDMRKLKLKQSELICFLVFVAGLGFDNGMKFGDDGEGFMRLNFACSHKLLKTALENLKNAVNELEEVDFDLNKLVESHNEIKDCD